MRPRVHATINVLAIGAIGSVAGADFLGLESEITEIDGVVGTATMRVYATFSDSSDQLHAVYGDSGNAMTIYSFWGDEFYQNPFGGPTTTSINPALYSVFPSLVYDSWVTIGLEDQVGNALLDIGIDFSEFEAGGGIDTSDGAWFATPDDPQVQAGSDLRVLIAQFTSTNYGAAAGHVNLQGANADGSIWSAQNVYFGPLPPAPGALGLLAIAGIRCRRRIG